MTSWIREEKTITTIEYRVPAPQPWGACWNEVELALGAATREFKDMSGWNHVPDDSVRVTTEDDTIVISFTRTK
jgi:hypothetical protein